KKMTNFDLFVSRAAGSVRYASYVAGTAATVLCGWILGVNLVVPVLLVSLGLLLQAMHRSKDLKAYRMLYLVFLYVIVMTATYMIRAYKAPIFLTPFSVLALLSVMLFNDLVVAFVLTVAGAVTAAAINANDLYMGMLFLTSGIAAALLANGARRRNEVIRAGVIVGVLQAATGVILTNFRFFEPMQYVILFANGAACGIIVLGILPVFEFLFHRVTNISLLEMADFNHPLLHRLMLEAPGTYHHSLIVGNLSEAACSAIGANSLLARIGAYYHDVGKLAKPEYFSENQDLAVNKHDTLSPTISKLVIMNHIKEGIDLARQYHLNASIIDFIQSHHGTSLVYYFYRRALERVEDTQEVPEEGFRYPGPKPRTKEIAVVLLADSVEAATRSMKSPSPDGIRELVHKIINNKFIDGQLDDCDLTLRDLEKIAQVFIHVLSGIYHTRITYPEQKK
ncbi:MAG TPA: HDIG domain-containing protein, partial [Candidatus Omnitrophota bacterium]|nr:HDIG domain-containing protein [Candidatus Omnitrophota bacterium]